MGLSQGVDFSYIWSMFNGSIVEGQNILQFIIGVFGIYNFLIINIDNGCISS